MQFRPEVRRSFVRGQEFICLPFLFLCMKLGLPLHGVIIRSTTYLWLGYGSESEIFGRDPFPWICRYIYVGIFQYRSSGFPKVLETNFAFPQLDKILIRQGGLISIFVALDIRGVGEDFAAATIICRDSYLNDSG